MVTHTQNLCSAFTHAKCTHTAVNIRTPWTHTRSSGQRFFAAVAGEQLGVWCLAQGHPSRGIEGGESVVYMHSPNLQFLPVWDSNLQPFDYESDSLTIRPRLVPTCDYTSQKSGAVIFRYYSEIGWKLHGTDKLICGALWICGLCHLTNQITLQRKWMLNDYKRTAKKLQC